MRRGQRLLDKLIAVARENGLEAYRDEISHTWLETTVGNRTVHISHTIFHEYDDSENIFIVDLIDELELREMGSIILTYSPKTGELSSSPSAYIARGKVQRLPTIIKNATSWKREERIVGVDY